MQITPAKLASNAESVYGVPLFPKESSSSTIIHPSYNCHELSRYSFESLAGRSVSFARDPLTDKQNSGFQPSRFLSTTSYVCSQPRLAR